MRGAYAARVRILLVSQMYPGADAPDLGTFVAQVERELLARGHEIERAVLDTRSGGKLRYLELARRTLRARRPDVVYAHFLVPSGLIAALAGRAPLVVTAHGRDVRNIGELPGVAAATRLVVRRAATVVCVSEYLRRELETKIPGALGKTEVVSSGVDLEQFVVTAPPNGPTRCLCIGALEERQGSRGRTTPPARQRPCTTCAVRPSGSRRSSCARRQVGEPDLDERAHRLLQPGLPGDLERLLPALARLLGIDALLQPVVARDEQLLYPLMGVGALHKATVTRHDPGGSS